MERANDWSDTIRNLAIVAVQLASLLLIAEHARWRLGERVRELMSRFERWRRQQEFEIYYATIWPQVRDAGN